MPTQDQMRRFLAGRCSCPTQDQMRRFLRGLDGSGSLPGVQLRMLDRSRNSSEVISPRAKRSARMRLASSSGDSVTAEFGQRKLALMPQVQRCDGQQQQEQQEQAAEDTAAWTTNSPPNHRGRGVHRRVRVGSYVNLSLELLCFVTLIVKNPPGAKPWLACLPAVNGPRPLTHPRPQPPPPRSNRASAEPAPKPDQRPRLEPRCH